MTTSTELAPTSGTTIRRAGLDPRPASAVAGAPAQTPCRPRRRAAGAEVARRPARATPAGAAMWQYRWDLTLTWRSVEESPDGAWESRIIAHSPEELCQLVLRTSYDPRIVSTRYERHAELDMSAAPAACTTCAEAYDELSPRRHWRPCPCGGHLVFECIVCGHGQFYPTPGLGCL